MDLIGKDVEEINRESDNNSKPQVVIIKYLCVDCRKERENFEERTYRKIDKLPGPKSKQFLQFYYIERKNLSEGGEGVDRHLLNEYMVPDKSLDAILISAFQRLKVNPHDKNLSFELSFNHLDDYVLDCERRGRQKSCAAFLKKLDLYEAQRCLRRSKILYDSVQQWVDIAYEKRETPSEYHAYDCKCKECEEGKRELEEMELADMEEEKGRCPRACCYKKTDNDRVGERFAKLREEREERLAVERQVRMSGHEERLALRRTNDERREREIRERNLSVIKFKPPPKEKKRAI